MANIRRLNLPDLYNARDLGGFPTRDGRATRFGIFIRSEAPVGLSPESIDYIRQYGVTASMDLRSSAETIARPSDLTATTDYRHMPLFDEAAMGGDHRRPPEHVSWGERYISMAERARDWAKNALEFSSECDGGLLYHCTTGKDRTGLLSCYLLSIAGVSREDIAADYSVSEIYLQPVYEKMRSGQIKLRPEPTKSGADENRPPHHMDESFFKTPASAMLTLIDYMNEKYGSVINYLREIGIGDKITDGIRNRFII